MAEVRQAARYRFGVFDLDTGTGELRRKGVRVRLHAQPCQVLVLLLERPGELLTREEIASVLWPEGTFVDAEHGVNSAVNRLREALGDKAANPRFVETLARRGYRFVAPAEMVGAAEVLAVEPETREKLLDRVLARPEDLPKTSPQVALVLFVLLQAMYLGFYVGALANLAEISDLMAPLAYAAVLFRLMTVTAAVMIPVRVFLLCAALFRAPAMRANFVRIWPGLLVMDLLWALSPFLLLHHINYGLAMACVAPLVYAPLAQRALVLMGAGEAPDRMAAGSL